MTKRRPAATFYDGIMTALTVIGRSDIAGLVGKSYQFLRQCADDDDDGHHLTVRDALKLDIACVKLGDGAPILDGYRAQMRRATAGRIEGEPMDALIRVMAEVGEMAGVLRDAVSPTSVGGENITAEELRALLREAGHARAAIDRLEDAALLVSGLMASDVGAP